MKTKFVFNPARSCVHYFILFCLLSFLVCVPRSQSQANPAMAAGALLCVGPQAVGCFLVASLITGATVLVLEHDRIEVWFANEDAKSTFIDTVHQAKPSDPRVPKGMEVIDLGKKSDPGYLDPIEDNFPSVGRKPFPGETALDDIEHSSDYLPLGRPLRSSDVYDQLFDQQENGSDITDDGLDSQGEIQTKEERSEQFSRNAVAVLPGEQSTAIEKTDDENSEMYALRATAFVKDRLNFQVKFALNYLTHADCLDYKEILELAGFQTVEYFLEFIPGLRLISPKLPLSSVVNFRFENSRCIKQH